MSSILLLLRVAGVSGATVFFVRGVLATFPSAGVSLGVFFSTGAGVCDALRALRGLPRPLFGGTWLGVSNTSGASDAGFGGAFLGEGDFSASFSELLAGEEVWWRTAGEAAVTGGG